MLALENRRCTLGNQRTLSFATTRTMKRRKSTQATPQQFSLAAAVFGWPPAPGHAAPASVPDAWLLQFREKHATAAPAVLSGIFTSCRSGRDWVLGTAPKATLTLDFTQELPVPVRLQQLYAARQLLSTRGEFGSARLPLQRASLLKDFQA